MDGEYRKAYGFRPNAPWMGRTQVAASETDLEEAITDITGQDLITADRETRINAIVTYREAQLVLRATAIENSTSVWRKRTQVFVKSPDRVVSLL